jgi:histidinol phosphatase-like PHP family hydrolase
LDPKYLPDHHLHSRYSRCSTGHHTLFDIIDELRQQQKPYYCVSDHIHYDFDDVYFPQHLAAAEQYLHQKPDRPLFLGAEITIIDISGTIAQTKASTGYLQYFMVGEHLIPGTAITMDDLTQAHRLLSRWQRNSSAQIHELLNTVENMYLGCLKRYQPQVLVHPFATFTRSGYIHTRMLEIFEQICEICAKKHIAIELNKSQIRECVTNPEPTIMDGAENLTRPEFYHAMVELIKHHNVPYSFGSDGHLLKTMGDISPCYKIAQDHGLDPGLCMNFLDEEWHIQPFSIEKITKL